MKTLFEVRIVARFVWMMLLTAGFLHAQVESGRFVGRITDQHDAVVVKAAVKATNVGTNVSQTAVTDSDGNFVITPVSAGTYNLSVSSSGFATTTVNGVEVQVGQIVREDLQLNIGSESTTVMVTAAAPLLSTDSATIGQVITNKQLTGLPLNGRGFYKLAELTPGASLQAATGNSLAIRPEVVNGNVISGIRGSATSFLLDGVDVSEQHQGGTFIQASIDALQEFSVQQSPYSAEFNRGGAFFNATTKSGTNKFHGGLFEFIRNDKLDARNYFALTRQILKRNQFGGDLGGPVTVPHIYNGKDRTFFFLDYEGQRLRQGLIFSDTVPSGDQRGGYFGSTPIYDPMSTRMVGGKLVRDQFQDGGVMNKIPQRRLSPQAQAILNYVPPSNNGANTASFTPSQAIDWDQFTVRLDDQITPSNRLFARWLYIRNRETDPNSSPLLGTASLTSIGQDIAAGLITNIGSNKVNEVRAHYLPSHVRLSAFLQGPDWNGQFGVTGLSAELRPGVGGAFPDYAWSGYTSIQGSAFDQRPKSQDRKAFEGTEDFTILKGKHSIKFGTLIRYYQWLGYDSEQFAGSFSFSGNSTRGYDTNGNPVSSSGDAFADFLLGLPSSVQRAYPAQNFGGQQTYYQFFVQDDIRLTPKLTVNAGIRYEYSPWLNGYKGQVGTFDPSLSKPIVVGGNGPVPDLSAQQAAPAAYQFFGQYIQTSSTAKLPYNLTYTDKRQWGPRIGFSYSASDKTVVRGGFGMFYEPEGTTGRVNLNMLPFRLNETVNQTQNVVPTRTLADFFLGTALGSAQANPTLVPTKLHLNVGYNEHYSLGIQQQFSQKDLFEISYVGNHGVDLNGSNDFNDPDPGPGAIQGRRPYQPWGTITFNTQDVSTSYNSLQMKLEHRESHGLQALVAYTWSKFMQFNQAPPLGGNRGYEYTLSPYDIPQNLAISGSYALPFGRGRPYMSHANWAVNGALGGWHIQTIVVLHSGVPYTPIISSDVANTGVGSQRPNLNPNGGNRNFVKSVNHWFDNTAYVQPSLYTYGTVKANTLRSDMYRQYDASIFKDFTMRGEQVLSFRAEFFNLSNTTSFSAPGASITSSASTAPVDTSTWGRIVSTSVPSRDIQFALKYNF